MKLHALIDVGEARMPTDDDLRLLYERALAEYLAELDRYAAMYRRLIDYLDGAENFGDDIEPEEIRAILAGA